MWLLILEALGALALLVLLVWWTMFAGRKRGERDDGGSDPR
jgi:cbb3-type cytochrome oxidase subunit 3